MKRDPNLQDLSRDHHHALVLARRAERASVDGDDDEVASMWEAVAAAFDADIGPHFEVEEQHLLPPLEAAEEEELVRHIRSDHQRLRELLAQTGNDRERLREFGQLLRVHVRFEESELFPAAEKVLGAAELAAVAEASAATEAALRRAEDRARKEQSDE